VQTRKQGAWSIVEEMEPVNATTIKHPAPSSFSNPQHDADSRLYRVDLSRFKLEPGKYRVAIRVEHSLLTGASQQNVTRAQLEGKRGASYLSIDTVQVPTSMACFGPQYEGSHVTVVVGQWPALSCVHIVRLYGESHARLHAVVVPYKCLMHTNGEGACSGKSQVPQGSRPPGPATFLSPSLVPCVKLVS
jgi:hypothetical protein